MAEVLVRWAADPAEMARLGRAGVQRARDVFAPAALARGVTAVYRRLLSAPPTTG
jgi:glycosyltransferase involved in cell wall biosynthesis